MASDRDQLKEAQHRAMSAYETRKQYLGQPRDFDWAHPLLDDPILLQAERGHFQSILWCHVSPLLKQTSLKLGRKPLVNIYETGTVDPYQDYKPLNQHKNTSFGMISISHHAFMMGTFQHIAQRVPPGGSPIGAFEFAAQMMREWCRETLSPAEMMEGMCLETASASWVPYQLLQGWERVHVAMSAMPGIVLSKPARLSLARLVSEWLFACRTLGPEHEIQLMKQIQLYAELEREYGGDEKSVCEFYEITRCYHQRRVLEAKKRTAPMEESFIALAPILGILGGAIPKGTMLDPIQTRAVHAAYAPGTPSGGRIELDLRDGEQVSAPDPEDMWQGVR